MKTTNKFAAQRILAAAFIGLVPTSMQAQTKGEKETAALKYQGKFLLVKREGISVGLCNQSSPFQRAPAASSMNVTIDAEHTKVVDELGCGLEPIHKGEVLKILSVRLFTAPRSSKSSGVEKGEEYLGITVQNVSPHSVTRGIGAFAHTSLERGAAFVAIPAGAKGGDFAGADPLANQWFTLLDGSDSANGAQLGNTAAGVFVNQVKSGMSFAEVESALGVPQTRVDLGEKVLYKYKDITIEFHGGRVTDVH